MNDKKKCRRLRDRFCSMSGRLPMLLSFLLPMLIASLLILYEHLREPGVSIRVVGDAWMQYYPFLNDFRNKLLGGESLLYSWTVGMGGGYVSTYAYYLASPLYLLSPLIPSELLPHFFTAMLVLKVSFAGYFMAWFLRIVYRRNDMSLPIFALMYAFCAWSAGYAINIVWFDVFALLPLLITGTVCLLREGKFRLYILSLAACIWCNYYIAFFCCIFVLMCFVGYCVCKWNGAKLFLRWFLRMAVCTAISVGLACVLLLPTLLALRLTNGAVSEEFGLLSLNIARGADGNAAAHGGILGLLFKETLPGMLRAMRRICSTLLTGSKPTMLEGLPNIFSGFSTLLLALGFLFCGKISKRERLVGFGMLSFFLLSFLLRTLDYFWHGMHFTNMIPYRFSFLFSFVLITMAYRAFLQVRKFKLKHLLLIASSGLLLLGNALLQNKPIILPLLVLLATCLWVLLQIKELPFHRYGGRIAAILLALTVVCEMSLCYHNGTEQIGVETQYRPSGELIYPHKQAELNRLMECLPEDELYRMEAASSVYVNDAALYGYRGVSVFSSAYNATTNRYLRAFGVSSRVSENTAYYYAAAPFTNTMCGVKYVYDRSGKYTDGYAELVATEGTVSLLENQSFISVGFMTQADLQNFTAREERQDLLVQQEELFRMATGVDEPLYLHCSTDKFAVQEGTQIRNDGTNYDYVASRSEDAQTISLFFPIEETGNYVYTTVKPEAGNRYVEIYRNGQPHHRREVTERSIFSLGMCEAGDEIEFRFTVLPGRRGTLSLDFAKQNDEVFDAGYASLADEPLILSEFSGDALTGSIEVHCDGLLYTSIPYEPGWSAYVDGEQVPIAETFDPQNTSVKLSDAFISFPLKAGEHDIELSYTPPGLAVGAAISFVSLIAFAVMCFLLRKKHVFLPE